MDDLLHKGKAKVKHAFEKITGPQTHYTPSQPIRMQRLGTETDIWRLRKQRGVNLGEISRVACLTHFDVIHRILVHSRAMDRVQTICERCGSWTGRSPYCPGLECKRDLRISLGHVDYG